MRRFLSAFLALKIVSLLVSLAMLIALISFSVEKQSFRSQPVSGQSSLTDPTSSASAVTTQVIATVESEPGESIADRGSDTTVVPPTTSVTTNRTIDTNTTSRAKNTTSAVTSVAATTATTQPVAVPTEPGNTPGRYEDTKFVRKNPDSAEAVIKSVGGIPRIVVDGIQTDPVLMSLVGTDEVALRQGQMAVSNGVKILRIFSEATLDYQQTKQNLDQVMEAYSAIEGDYYYFLGFGINASATEFGGDVFEDNYVNQKGHVYPYTSVASDKWMVYAKTVTENLIKAVNSDPRYSDKVIAYSPCGSYGGEWFGPNFWNGHYDTSPVCQEKFREYLKDKYGTDTKLKDAWNNSAATLQTAAIPDNVPAYLSDDSALPMVLTDPQYQNLADYQDFYSELMASRIIEICQFIKKKTENRKLTCCYYGYQFEISIAVSGCLGLESVLASPYVDILCAPDSYSDRNEGGTGASMTRLSSVAAAGKIWMDESDYRSPIRTSEGIQTGEAGLGDEGSIASLDNLIEVMKRQYGKNMVYDSGTWWLDLLDRGWYDSEEFWKASKDLQELWYKYASFKTAKDPEIAFIWDDDSLCMLGKAWQTSYDLLRSVKLNAHKAGLSFGFYSMQDLLKGRIDGCKLYIFYTPWNITAEQATVIKKKLNGKTSVWMCGTGKTDPAVFNDLVGMQVKNSATNQSMDITFADGANSIVSGVAGTFVSGYTGVELTTVSDDSAIPLATYDSTGEVAVAVVENGKTKSIFYGSTSLPNKILRAFAAYAGATVYMNTEDTFYTDGYLAVVHAKTSGEKTIRFPKKCDVYDYFKGVWYTDVTKITVDVSRNVTRYFFYGSKEIMQKCGIG